MIPYSLVEVDGVGFAKADDIARRVGIGELDTKRVKGYILHHFQEEAESGHHIHLCRYLKIESCKI